MAACLVCGGLNFEKHDGFLYCSECQTQSQDYHEEEYEFRQFDSSLAYAKSSKKSSKGGSKSQQEDDGGDWTSWELFNYILHGMTQEMKLICRKENFESTVLAIWTCYLNRLEAGFLSFTDEDLIPKLGVKFKKRDAKILYNFAPEEKSNSSRRRKLVRKKSQIESDTSQSSVSGFQSKQAKSRKRMKIMSKEYEESMSRISGESTLANETIESLGRSSDNESFNTSDVESISVNELKRIGLSKDARREMKKGHGGKIYTFKRQKYPLCKKTLISVIHLALLVIKSNIQISDLLRFIREGHLSFAKVTHFLPREIKIPRKHDSILYLTESDLRMPNHVSSRTCTMNLAKSLNFEQLPQPNLEALIRRYCKDLKLPDQITIYSIRILRLYFNNSKRNRKSLVTSVQNTGKVYNFEASAMGCIIVVLKFYFGLDDKIETILSRFAKTVNQLKNGSDLFVFEDWQKYIECRKAILKDFHYPTQERFDSDHYNSQKFIDMLFYESKDEFIAERFNFNFENINRSKLELELQNKVVDIASGLESGRLPTFMKFAPSLTPQESYIKIIKEKAANKELDFSTTAENFGVYERNDLPWDILNMEFKNCDITFTRNPADSIKLLEENNFKVVEVSKSDLLNKRDIDPNQYTLNNEVLFVIVDGSYWLEKGNLSTKDMLFEKFMDELFDKLPNNFKWLLAECARMIENDLNVLYKMVCIIENVLLDAERKIVETKSTKIVNNLKDSDICTRSKTESNIENINEEKKIVKDLNHED